MTRYRAHLPPALALAVLLAALPAQAQHEHQHPPEPERAPAERKPAERKPTEQEEHGRHGQPEEPGPPADHAMPGHEGHAMPAFFGPYAMTRESSGTAWQPDSAPHQGRHVRRGPWDLMLHAQATVVYVDQDGPRGDQEVMGTNMLMLMGSRPAGPGRFGVRAMVSAEPWTIGDEGYPLLLQTGETADGVTPLVDRQHPHDLFMELAATYSLPLGESASVFAYVGLPGEPALGPPAFPHRFSAWENPAAPLSHHWQDSTHIAFGVATLGVTRGRWKLEGSLFTGREPDERRTDIEDPKMDSWALRASYQPARDWSLQASHGRLESPEQLEPDVDVARTVVSAAYNRPFPGGTWQTTFAWGRNAPDPGDPTDAILLESAWARGRHTLFGRAERVENGELFGHGHEEGASPGGGDHPGLEGRVFEVGELTLGYLHDVLLDDRHRLGVGALGTVALVPAGFEPIYGSTPLSWMAFLRLRL